MLRRATASGRRGRRLQSVARTLGVAPQRCARPRPGRIAPAVLRSATISSLLVKTPGALDNPSMSVADDETVRRLIELAHNEDLERGDISSDLLEDPGQPASFHLIAKQRGVFAGREIAAAVLAAYGSSIDIQWTAAGADEPRIDSLPTPLPTIHGPLAALLAAERVLLNFLQRLCGVA